MPRAAKPSNEPHRSRQAVYREKLANRGEPEASHVDVAMAAALAAYADAIEDKLGSPVHRPVMQMLLRGTLDLLVSEGFDHERSVAVLRRRVSRSMRDNMDDIAAGSRLRERVTKFRLPPLLP